MLRPPEISLQERNAIANGSIARLKSCEFILSFNVLEIKKAYG